MADEPRSPSPTKWASLSEPERQAIRDRLARGRETQRTRNAARSVGEPPEIDPTRIGGNGADDGADDGARDSGRASGGGGGSGGGFWRSVFSGPGGKPAKP